MILNPDQLKRYTVGVLVDNEPGVLSRVSGLFSRRGFNIESLAVGPTQDSEVSRITIVVTRTSSSLSSSYTSSSASRRCR